MNKQARTLGIILALGTTGCAGFGLQRGSNLSPPFLTQNGLDSLWSSPQPLAAPGLEPSPYAEQELGELWNGGEKTAESAEQDRFVEGRTLENLWLSTSVPSRILVQ